MNLVALTFLLNLEAHGIEKDALEIHVDIEKIILKNMHQLASSATMLRSIQLPGRI